jgi:hypothetical protein
MNYASHWIKLVRAKQHLDELKAAVRSYSDSRPYEVSQSVEGKGNRREWVYRATISDAVDPLLPAIAGDFLFGARSAIDHIAVALVPNKRKSKASFPIATVNIWEKDPTTGDYFKRNREAIASWETATDGMPAKAYKLIETLQPYQWIKDGQDPNDHVLAILSALHNADKHRQLVFVKRGIAPTRITVRAHDERMYGRAVPPLPSHKLAEDGAVIARLPHEMDVQVEGAVQLAIGSSQHTENYPFPGVCDKILDFVGTRVLAPLENLIR